MNEKIKVMHLIWSMSEGGAQQIVLNYLKDFKCDKDIELKLFVYTNPTNSKYDRFIKQYGYNVEYLNNPQTKVKIPYIKRLFQRSISRKAWLDAIERFKPNIIHVHISSLLSDTLDPIIKSKVPISFDTLHSDPRRYHGRKKRYICKAFKEGGVIPICVTNEQVNLAKQCYGISKYEVLYNGIDISNIKSQLISKVEARKKLGLPNDAYIVAGIGRLNSIKNFTLLIDAFNIVQKNRKKSLLIFAGDGKERNKLNKQIKKLGIQNKVVFLGNQDDIIPIYCAADVLGITSISESSSLTLLEAQLCNLRSVISSGVPKESIITKYVKQMSLDDDIMKWAEALMNQEYIGEKVNDESEYNVHEASKRLKEIYIRYWLNYNK